MQNIKYIQGFNLLHAVLVLLILGLLVKDVGRFGDIYIIRSITQVTALGVGLYCILFRKICWGKYILLWLYIGSLLIGSATSSDPTYTILQVISLAAVLLFFVAFQELNCSDEDRNKTLITTVYWVSGIVCILSLVALFIYPHIAYLEMDWVNTTRYRGIFGQPATLAGCAGFLIGCAWFGREKLWVKTPLLLVGLVNIILSGARTFIVASAVALGLQAYRKLHRRKIIIGAVFAIWIIGGLFLAELISPMFLERAGEGNIKSIIRENTIEDIGGRTKMWHRGMDAFKKRPLFGYGFSIGAEGLFADGRRNTYYDTELKKTKYTLHNGFVQVLLDGGIIGFIFYISILGLSIIKYLKSWNYSDKVGQYSIIFITLANMGESFLFSASTTNSLIAWYFVVYGLSIEKRS